MLAGYNLKIDTKCFFWQYLVVKNKHVVDKSYYEQQRMMMSVNDFIIIIIMSAYMMEKLDNFLTISCVWQ